MKFNMGQRVRVAHDGREGEVVGYGQVRYSGDERGEVVVVDFKDGSGDILPFFDGDVEEVEPEGYLVEVAYTFKAVVPAFSEYDAEQALRDALVSELTWDGDDLAPDPLRELEMRSIPVPAKELV